MTDATTSDSVSDHAYFQALEAAFIRLRGAPLLLSPADWQVAKSWRREGIPLELVVQVMERIFERQSDTGDRAGIRSLRYFKKAVSRSWRKVLELGGGDRAQSEPQPFDTQVRLERLASMLSKRASPEEALIDGPTGPRLGLAAAIEEVAVQIARLQGTTGEIEASLQSLDRAMMERLRQEIDEATVAQIEKRAQESLGTLSGRLAPADRKQTLELLIRRRLRQELKLPVLSLFSLEAAGAESA